MDVPVTHDDVAKQLLLEVIEEEAVDSLEEAIAEYDRLFDRNELDEKSRLISHRIGDELLGEVLSSELVVLAGECFDDIIAEHRLDLDAVQKVNSLLHNAVKVLAEEIVLDVIGENLSDAECEEVFKSVLSDALREECTSISKEVLDHYHMRVALSQYKHIQASASSFLIDKVVLDSLLLSHNEPAGDGSEEKHFSILEEEKDEMLNNVVFDILLAQSLSLHSCFPKNLPSKILKDIPCSKLLPAECLPLNWYKDKLMVSVAEDVVVSMLCDRLDESMGLAAREQMKDEAVSLDTQLSDIR